MKLLHIYLLLALLGGISVVNAEKTVYGPGDYTNQTFTEPLTIMGPLTATGLKAPKIVVHGPARLNDSMVGTLTVMGPLKADKTTFEGPVSVTGAVTTKDSTFKGLLEISGKDLAITLEDTHTKNVLVTLQKSGVTTTDGQSSFSFSFSTKKKPSGTTIHLKDNSVIDGSLTVAQGEASLIKDDNARITGTIYGVKTLSEKEQEKS